MNLRTYFGAATVAFILGIVATTGRAQVVINEFAYDDSGDDDEEFVELFNAGDSDVDLRGWRLMTGTDMGLGALYSLPADTVIEARDYLVVGSLAVPEVEVVLPGPELFGNGPAYIILWQGDGKIADRVVYEANKGLTGFPDEAIAEGALWGNHVLVAGTRMSWQRWFDGLDTERNDVDFGHLPWTPGTSNDRARPIFFQSDFDDGDPEGAVEELPGSFAPGRIIDPESISGSNPNPIPESPDGGFALIAWDPAGGGNFIVLEAEPAVDMMFEAWVHFDATPKTGEESETWSIGLRGTSGTFYNIPILYNANGNTGVTWTYQVTASGATLYLIDEGYGGLAVDRVHLGVISILPGENDGWQRLRLEVEGEKVVGYFGGTYGSTNDGDQIEGTLKAAGMGNFYMGYREALANNSSARPLTVDGLRVGPPEKSAPLFQRGNSSADANTDLSDAVFLLNFLFLGGLEPPCRKAADADDGGTLDLTDAVLLLNYLFLGGGEPAQPFPGCGRDPTTDDLTCEAFQPCA